METPRNYEIYMESYDTKNEQYFKRIRL